MGKNRLNGAKAEFKAAVKKHKPAAERGKTLPVDDKRRTDNRPKLKKHEPEPLDVRPFRDKLLELVTTDVAPSAAKSLLADASEIKNLPPIPLGSLPVIVKDKREHYAKFLSLIMLGCSRPVAASVCGISRANITMWTRQGLSDLESNRDTYYSRFVNDIQFASAVPTADAETAIHRKDPLEWLRSGPGKWQHPEGTWQQPSAKAIEPQEIPITVAIADGREGSVEDDVDLMADAPTVEDLPAALQVLKDSGLGYVIENAERQNAESEEAMKDSSSADNQAPST